MEELRAFDVNEEALSFFISGSFCHLLSERVCNCLGYERFTATRRAVQQNSLRRREVILTKKMLV